MSPRPLRPPLLDINEGFDISKPFQLSERLDALAYHMALVSPRWEKSVNTPSCSKSRTTLEYVEKDRQCTARPLRGPPPSIIQEFLPVTIDLSNGSPLTLSMENSPYYSSCRAELSKKTMPTHPLPDENENSYLGIVQGSLSTLISLAAVSLLQLWISDGDSIDIEAFEGARDVLLSLHFDTITRDAGCIPDHAGLGLKTKRTLGAMANSLFSLFTTLDRKSKDFVEYWYTLRSTKNPPFDARSKDGLMQQIIDDGRPFYLLRNIFLNKENDDDDDDGYDDDDNKNKGGWHVETLHLLAQV